MADSSTIGQDGLHWLRLGDLLVSEGLLKPLDLVRALDLQQRTKVQLGRILVALGLIRRYDLYQVLAQQWKLPFVDLVQQRPDPELVRRFPPDQLVRHQFVPVRLAAGEVVVATARQPGTELEELVQQTLSPESITYSVTTEWDVDLVVRTVFRQELLDGAIFGLYYRNPHESAYTVFTLKQYAGVVILILLFLVGLYLAFAETVIFINFFINIGFGASILFKFFVSLHGAAAERWEPVTDEEVASLHDDELPTYTILVPVYREANIIGLLIDNLAVLDYPKEKLEILVLLEEDDAETVEAAKAGRPPGNVQLLVVPNQIPKTKPKACNVGLFFSRGEYLVIYDAEDRPEPDQLKKAVVAFRKGPPNLVCVQGALNYFNSRENFLTRMFTLEYSYWFDYMLPGLDRARLPIPLGGTSNHFRTDVLRELGGWDPFNVTEDADLGVRASARGYTVGVINSSTYEEANNHAGNWVRQRSRWIKGYMQTSLVHLRNPSRLIRQVGWRQAMGFLFLVAGTPITFLSAPPMWIIYTIWLLTGTHGFDPYFPSVVLYISLLNLLFGNTIAIYLSMLAVFKRKYYHLILWSLLHPFYWVLHSIAAYKALGQLFTRPFYWEKTVHGISKQLGSESTQQPVQAT